MPSLHTPTRLPRVTVLVPAKHDYDADNIGDAKPAHHPNDDRLFRILPYAPQALSPIAVDPTRLIVVQPDTRLDPRRQLVSTLREVFSDTPLSVWEDPTPVEPMLRGGESETALWNLFAHPLAGPRCETAAGHLLIGRSGAFRQVLRAVEPLIDNPVPLLLQGEKGVGKRQLALAIHERSASSDKSCWTVECNRLQLKTWQRALFGDELDPGGLLEHPGVGTIIFDEIAALPPFAQRTLLESVRATSHDLVPRARLIFLTSHDLGRLVADYRLLAELFFELSGQLIGLPPLRQRPGDISLLVEHFVQSLAPAMRLGNIPSPIITQELVEHFQQHEWPGNIAELRRVVVGLHLQN